MSIGMGSHQATLYGCTNSHSTKWDIDFHVHSNASNLAMGVILAQNPTRKCDQLIAYAS